MRMSAVLDGTWPKVPGVEVVVHDVFLMVILGTLKCE